MFVNFFLCFSFLSSFAVIATAQIFGLFPVSGILHKDSSQLSFKFKSFRFIYSITIQLGIAFMFVTSIYKQLSNRIEYTKVGKEVYKENYSNLKHLLRLYFYTFFCLFPFAVKLIFFLLNFLVYSNFVLVARQWPTFVKFWENAEQKLTKLHFYEKKSHVQRFRIKRICIFIMFLAFSECTRRSWKKFLWKMSLMCSKFKWYLFYSWTHSGNCKWILFIKRMLECSFSRRSLFQTVIHRLFYSFYIQHISRIICTSYQFFMVIIINYF